ERAEVEIGRVLDRRQVRWRAGGLGLFRLGRGRRGAANGFVRQRGQVRIHLRRVPEPLVDLFEPADGGDVLGRGPEDRLELLAGGVVVAGFDEAAAERDARREVGRVPLKAGAARIDGVLIAPDPPELFRERRKRNRRRVRLDPASQFLYPRVLRHWLDSTTTLR